ncbi:MAG TPA: YihY/virulence factor BrkB family protein, partial [Thermoleophilaceae bacterium]|nr:YihY/virulence factor BrkB family protein [Thermoleophilaceae bacterium]
SLMSLFPAALVALSLLGLLGQYPGTYNAILDYARDVAPMSVIDPLDRSLRNALQSKGTAATALALSTVIALYGTTGALEAARRALNVIYGVESGRSFLQRKATDIVSTFVLLALVLVSLVGVFVGGRLARDLLGFAGLGQTAVDIWKLARWPAAVLAAMLAFAYTYWITPDRENRSFRWITPGAVVGVTIWLAASIGFSAYISSIGDVGAVYGTFAAAIVLVGWLWLTNVAMLFGAEVNVHVERAAR